MNTLTTSPLAPLLDRLFDEADAAWESAKPAIDDISPEERERLKRSKTEYRDFYRDSAKGPGIDAGDG
jgi:hypothetical protein